MSLMIYLFLVSNDSKRNVKQCESSKYPQNSTTKYIFNLARWRELNFQNEKDHTSWCSIPDELKTISKAICNAYKMGDCVRLPCRMIYSSPSTLENIKCMNDGRILKNNDETSLGHQSNFQCKRGFTLDMFSKKYHPFSYPSIIADPFNIMSGELYVDVLNNLFRTCDSMWGFIFNFESITNYPWMADDQNLKLFDITFGYDRSIYDFVPAPWLFNYVDRLEIYSKRMSIQEAISSKKPINSDTKMNSFLASLPPVSSM